MEGIKPNEVRIIIQSKDEPRNLFSTKEKIDAFKDGLTVVFMEGQGVESGQMGIELIINGFDIRGIKAIMGFQVTENNWEAIMGAFIGCRMRFNRMPPDQWGMVRHYVKEQVKRFIETLQPEKRPLIETDLKKFFGIS